VTQRFARAAFAAAFLISLTAAIHGLQLGAQSCGGKQTYTAPGGSVVGQGSTERRATLEAQRKSRVQVGYSVPTCSTCPSMNPCTSVVTYAWDAYVEGTPSWDPVLGVYTVSISWECCDATQYCSACP
jgi:hypothetical protein